MANITTETEIYSDIMSDFDIHPVKKDVVRLVNEAAVKTSIKNLLMTRKTERFFNPTLGAGLSQYLFETMTPITANAIKQEIEQVINNFESRCSLIDVQVRPIYEDDTYAITIVFYVVNRADPVTLSVSLERSTI